MQHIMEAARGSSAAGWPISAQSKATAADRRRSARPDPLSFGCTETEISDSMETLIWVTLGGAIGTCGRYLLSGFVAQTIGETFPWGTLIINVTGSFVIG